MATEHDVRLAITVVAALMDWMTCHPENPTYRERIYLVAWRIVSLFNGRRVFRQSRPSGSGATGFRSCRSSTHLITTSASRS